VKQRVNETPFTTIIIPAYNEQDYIGICLKSLVEQDYDKKAIEILVVDGISSDASRRIVREWGQKYAYIKLLDNPKRATAAGVNVGIRAAQGDVIIILGAHSFIAPDFLGESRDCLQKSGADCVGGPLRYVGESSLAKTISLAMASPFGVGNAYFRYSTKAQFVDTLAFGAYKKAVFDRIGLFDENLIANEDYDLNYRIRKTGGKIFLSPTIKSFYFNQASFAGLWKQYFRYGFWKVRMLCKYPESIAIRQAVPPVFVLSLLLIISLSLFFQPFIYLFLAIISTYLICSLTTSLHIASKQGWRHFPRLPLVFLYLHLGWGSGFLYGLTKWGAHLKKIR